MAASAERVFIATPIPTAGAKVIASPFQFWTTGEEFLRIRSLCAVTGVTIGLQGRSIDPSGTIGVASWTHTAHSDRTAALDVFPLGVGAMLNLVVFALTGTPQLGQCFVMVELVRGAGAGGRLIGTILQGYITGSQMLAWPGSPVQLSTDGQGALRAITGTQPAVGLGISETVPTGAMWELLSFHTTFPNVAVFAAETLLLTISINGSSFIGVPSQQRTLTNTAVCDAWWLAGFSTPATADTPFVTSSLPIGLRLPAGAVIQTSGIGGGAQYSAPNYLVREWLTVN
jgi:hypothetical protein